MYYINEGRTCGSGTNCGHDAEALRRRHRHGANRVSSETTPRIAGAAEPAWVALGRTGRWDGVHQVHGLSHGGGKYRSSITRTKETVQEAVTHIV